jgi:hypothetical protein
VGSWDEGEIYKMMNAGEVDIKEWISLSRQEYFVLKEEIKDDECGWSNAHRSRGLPPAVLPAASCTGGEAKAARGFSAIRDPTSERWLALSDDDDHSISGCSRPCGTVVIYSTKRGRVSSFFLGRETKQDKQIGHWIIASPPRLFPLISQHEKKLVPFHIATCMCLKKKRHVI